MNQKTITLLFVATLLVGGLAWLKLAHDESSVASHASTEKLLPGLSTSINDAATITLQRKDGTLTLARDDAGAWGLVEKSDYAVETESVKQLLITLMGMTALEAKTDNPELYSKLGVQDPEAEGSTSALLTVKDKSGKELAKLIVGKQSEGHGGMPSGNTYVRRPGEKQSWLVKGALETKEKASDWLKKKILEVKRDRIRSVEVRHPDGEVVHVERGKPEDANFELAGIPEGQELSYPSVAGSVTSTLEYLNLEDVLPADKVDFSKDAGPVCEFRTFDGLKISVHVKEEGEKCYARFEAAYEAPPQIGPTPPPAGETPDAPKPPEKKPEAQKSPEDVQKEASELQARLSKWVYQIPAYNKPAFTKHMKDMLKAKTPPPAPAGDKPAEEKPAAQPPAGDKPADEKPADDKPH